MTSFTEALALSRGNHSLRRINSVAYWGQETGHCVSVVYHGHPVLRILDNGEYIYDPGNRWSRGSVAYMNRYGPGGIKRKPDGEWYLPDGRILCAGIRVKV